MFTVQSDDSTLLKAFRDKLKENGYKLKRNYNNLGADHDRIEVRADKYIPLKRYNKAHYKLPEDWNEAVERILGFKEGEWIKYDVRGLKEYEVGRITDVEKNAYRVISRTVARTIPKDNAREATKEEIKEHLVEDAKCRGFEVGKKYDGTNVGYPTQTPVIHEGRFVYDENEDTLRLGGWCIYRQGKWAEVVEVDSFHILDYNAYVEDGKAYVGCEGDELKLSDRDLEVLRWAFDNLHSDYGDLKGADLKKIVKGLHKLQDKI